MCYQLLRYFRLLFQFVHELCIIENDERDTENIYV